MRQTLFAKKSSNSSPGLEEKECDIAGAPQMGIATGLVLSIYRQNKNSNLSGKPVATGKYDVHTDTWNFESSEDETKSWLEDVFAKQYSERHGKLPRASMSHVFYIKDMLMPRKGLSMKWEIVPDKKSGGK